MLHASNASSQAVIAKPSILFDRFGQDSLLYFGQIQQNEEKREGTRQGFIGGQA